MISMQQLLRTSVPSQHSFEDIGKIKKTFVDTIGRRIIRRMVTFSQQPSRRRNKFQVWS